MLRSEEGREHPHCSPQLPNPQPARSLRPHPPADPTCPSPVPLAEPPCALGVCPWRHGQHLSRILHMHPFPLPFLWAAQAWGWPDSDPTVGPAMLGWISITFLPWYFLVSFGCQGFLGCVVAAMWCFGVAQLPGAGCSLPCCIWAPAAIGATSQPRMQPCPRGLRDSLGTPS